jgi:uncharacterized protein (DUF1501 family)
MSNILSRREVIKSGGMIAVGLVAPRWLSSIAQADVLRQAKGGKAASDTVLVVCQWSGGNDGLNTVVPYASKAYYKLRPMIGIPEAKVLKLSGEMGLNPGLTGLAELFQQGKVAIIQNVGYPQPNRSHFKSMEIWQSASPESNLKYGWLGRHFDNEMRSHPLNPVVALGLSTEQPLALAGQDASIPCFASLADLRNMIGDADSERMLREIQGADAPNGTATRAVQNASRSALDAVSVLQKQLATYKSQSTYANDAFASGFKQIAQLIATSPATRVVYFQAGGFDTHARQVEGHQSLLKNFGNAVNTFQKEMEAIGKADKVVTLVFSEFGRRAQENASLGTDHGAAAPMFLIGSKVKGGLHGPIPDLDNLLDGDIRHTQDFREVYAATLDTWMGGDSETVLAQNFTPVDVFNV